MSAATRRKGIDAEREVATIWTAAGATVRGLEGSGDHLIVLPSGVTIHSEVKRQERLKLPEWIRQASAEAPPGCPPVVAFRQNQGAWYVALTLADLVKLCGCGG